MTKNESNVLFDALYHFVQETTLSIDSGPDDNENYYVEIWNRENPEIDGNSIRIYQIKEAVVASRFVLKHYKKELQKALKTLSLKIEGIS